MSSILVSLLGNTAPLTFSKSTDGPGFLKRDSTKLKPGLVLRLLSKGLFLYKGYG